MNLPEAVRAVFAPDGVLALAVENFRPRQAQTDMALAVAEAIRARAVLVVEAGTGVGKTYAYLVAALLSGERVLLSTATKTLQDQLYARDLPRLMQALGLPLRKALLKGRANYLCLHRLEQAQQQQALLAPPERAALARVSRWAQGTRSGDLAQLTELNERLPLLPLVTSTRDNCLGSDCPKFRDCHLNLARREALGADVVVINHHLFFADLAVRESGMAELLPSVNTVIFDEAHQLNQIGVQFLGHQLSTNQVFDFCRDLLAAGLQEARGLADWPALAAGLEHSARELRLCAGQAPPGGLRLKWDGLAPAGLEAAAWSAALQALRDHSQRLNDILCRLDELGPDLQRLTQRSQDLSNMAQFFLGECKPDAVRWAELNQQLRLVEAPLDIAETVRKRLQASDPNASASPSSSAQSGQPKRSWVFTSATLGDDERLSWFTEPCGLTDARVLRLDSPFDYARQAAVYVPQVFPQPGEPGHSQAVAQLVARMATVLGGRTLVLTTSLRALRSIAQSLPDHLAGSGLQVLSQEQGPKHALLERLRAGTASGQGGCVLVGSVSFWEGVDIPGAALQLVVIDKLPFPMPTDPLVQARSRRLEQSGRSAFNDYHLPEAAVALKQGAGRLIRSEQDRGLLVICDTRLNLKSYGRRLSAALPSMRRLNQEQDALQLLRDLSAVPATAA